MSEKPTLIIGDCHGHFDRLERLLLQEGILGPCDHCDATGQIGTEIECLNCNGDGSCRVNHDVRVIQLGDLGHFGGATGSPTGDLMCYKYADSWFDDVLWGNHDRAVVDFGHAFNGYMYPDVHTKGYMDALWEQGKLKMATEAHGYLIVHAGIALGLKHLTKGHDAKSFAAYLNYLDTEKMEWGKTSQKFADGEMGYAVQQELRKEYRAIDAISSIRGGRYPEGGALWMDWNQEKHLRGEPFKYICGHTAHSQGIVDLDQYGNYNIDIGGKNERRLAGLWLAENETPRVVRVDL